MLPNGKSVLLALLAAHYAQAAPINTHSKQVRAVIDSVKAQLKADNMTDASTAVDEAAAALRANGITNDNIIDRLEHELVVGNRSHFFVLPLELQLESLKFWRFCI